MKRVTCEIMLMCLGRNIRKMFTLIDKPIIKSKYWENTDNLKKEMFPFPKQKRKKAETKLFHFVTAPCISNGAIVE